MTQTNAFTPAGKLVSAFGDPDQMATLYAPNVQWTMAASLGMPKPEGREAVIAFNRAVWTNYYRPDCTVDILDETGDEQTSAVRFIYSAHSIIADRLYVNEYTVFVRSGPEGITAVFESPDTGAIEKFYAQQTPKI